MADITEPEDYETEGTHLRNQITSAFEARRKIYQKT